MRKLSLFSPSLPLITGPYSYQIPHVHFFQTGRFIFFTQAGKLLFQCFRVSCIFFSTIFPVHASLPDEIKLSYVRKLPITIKKFKEWFNLIIVFFLVMRAYVLISIPFWMNGYNLSSKELNVVRNKRNSCLLLKPILNFIRESS